ncbi:MAG: hypothetical protein RL441_847, partial [Actinomycetota bacterium]
MKSNYPETMRETWFNRLLILNIAVQAGIIVTGGVVRVTASGLGCPTWPECVDGSIIPTDAQTEAWHKYVEFGNRTLTGVLFVVAFLVALAVFKHTADRRMRLLGMGSLLGTFGQALLGGVTVLTGLNPYTVASHLLLSIVIVALCVRLWWNVRHSSATTSPARAWFSRVFVAVAAIVVLLGTLVTGSGPHSGDTKSLTRMPFEPRVIAWVHADAVWLFVGLIIASYALIRFGQVSLKTRTSLNWLTTVVLLQ